MGRARESRGPSLTRLSLSRRQPDSDLPFDFMVKRTMQSGSAEVPIGLRGLQRTVKTTVEQSQLRQRLSRPRLRSICRIIIDGYVPVTEPFASNLSRSGVGYERRPFDAAALHLGCSRPKLYLKDISDVAGTDWTRRENLPLVSSPSPRLPCPAPGQEGEGSSSQPPHL